MCMTRGDCGTKNHALPDMSAQLGAHPHPAKSLQDTGQNRAQLTLRQMFALLDTHAQPVQRASTESHAHSDSTLQTAQQKAAAPLVRTASIVCKQLATTAQRDSIVITPTLMPTVS